MHSGYFLTVLTLVGFNLLCPHLCVGFALLQFECLTVGQTSCSLLICTHSFSIPLSDSWEAVTAPNGAASQCNMKAELALASAPCFSWAGGCSVEKSKACTYAGECTLFPWMFG